MQADTDAAKTDYTWRLQENVISDSDLELLVEFIRTSKRFTQFTKVREFEEAFASWLGCKHCVMVNSGSSANLVAVAAAKELHGWAHGAEVLVPAVTWPTTVTPVMQLGLKPIFVDVNLRDLSFDYGALENSITSRSVAVFVAHLLGFPADVQQLRAICAKHNLLLLEDCCESQGAIADGQKVGRHGLAGTFSFYWGHHMTTVEGGMLCTDDQKVYETVLLKRSHGLARELPPDRHKELAAANPGIDFRFLFLTDGFNVRNTEFNAVLGLAQLARIDEFIRIRNRNYARFLEICEPYEDDLIPIRGSGISSFVLPFILRNSTHRAALEQLLRSAGIESRPLISGNLLRQPFLAAYGRPSDFSNAEVLHENAFYIGNNQFVSEERLALLDGLISRFFGGRRTAGSRS
jgi:CDP-6-deoxy-D-xylo-4-hexulose-3-dehydrase